MSIVKQQARRAGKTTKALQVIIDTVKRGSTLGISDTMYRAARSRGTLHKADDGWMLGDMPVHVDFSVKISKRERE